MFGRLLGWYTIYIHFRGLLPPDGILPRAKSALRPSLAFSYIGSVTARHSSSGRQPNFAAWYKEWNEETGYHYHLYSVGRPPRWASAHILVNKVLRTLKLCCVLHPVHIPDSGCGVTYIR